jgi:hypothetical protein
VGVLFCVVGSVDLGLFSFTEWIFHRDSGFMKTPARLKSLRGKGTLRQARPMAKGIHYGRQAQKSRTAKRRDGCGG